MTIKTFTIFSPEGEMFENVSALNARDLTAHRGWTYERIVAAATPAAPKPPVAPTITPPVTPAKTEETNVVSDHAGNGNGAGESAGASAAEGEAVDQSAGEADDGHRTSVEAFADLIEKADVQAYIAANFPDFKIDGRANRDKLVAQAIELANGEPVEEAE